MSYHIIRDYNSEYLTVKCSIKHQHGSLVPKNNHLPNIGRAHIDFLMLQYIFNPERRVITNCITALLTFGCIWLTSYTFEVTKCIPCFRPLYFAALFFLLLDKTISSWSRIVFIVLPPICLVSA